MKILFEITACDLLARIGTIQTNKGIIHTPCFVPVVHPESSKNFLPVDSFQDKFGIDFIITSSYILRKRLSEKFVNLHDQTHFPGPIMTDSGAFQSLVYGEIELTPENVISYQEGIQSDFAVPLDIPISITDSYDVAKSKVETTIARCNDVPSLIKSNQIKWVGPIQGGKYLDLVEKSAIEISKIPTFEMYAIGSVVEIMNNYQYDTLLDIIFTAKKYLNPAIPVHLFGAGHPSMFPFIVAAGCDSFDSAAYTLYAQEERYITNTQTFLLNELDNLPCNCPICNSTTIGDLRSMKKNDRITALAAHNLYVCQVEMKNIHRAIASGTLWNVLESRARVHPSLMKGFNSLKKYISQLAINNPSTNNKGLFMVTSSDLNRPEIFIHKERLANVLSANMKDKLLIISLLGNQLSETYEFSRYFKDLTREDSNLINDFTIWILDPYFGIIPLELSEVYPLSQYVSATNLSRELMSNQAKLIVNEILNHKFTEIIMLGDLSEIQKIIKVTPNFSRDTTTIKSYNFQISDDNLSRVKEILRLLL